MEEAQAPDGARTNSLSANSLKFPENYPRATHKAPKFRAGRPKFPRASTASAEFSVMLHSQPAHKREAAWFPWAFLNHQQVEPAERSESREEPRNSIHSRPGKRIRWEEPGIPSDMETKPSKVFYPHEFTVQESLWKACPRTFLHFPPSGESHADHNSRLVRRPPSSPQRPPTEKQREGRGLWRERERMRERGEVVEREGGR